MSSLRNSYDRITKPYPKPDSGFIQYNDDEYNSSNAFVISNGTTSKIPNNATSMLGNGIDVELYDGSVITPENLNDNYIFES